MLYSSLASLTLPVLRGTTLSAEMEIQSQHFARLHYYQRIFLPAILSDLEDNASTSEISSDTTSFSGDLELPSLENNSSAFSIFAALPCTDGTERQCATKSRMERFYLEKPHHDVFLDRYFLHQDAIAWPSPATHIICSSLPSSSFVLSCPSQNNCDSHPSTPPCSDDYTSEINNDTAPGWRLRKIRTRAGVLSPPSRSASSGSHSHRPKYGYYCTTPRVIKDTTTTTITTTTTTTTATCLPISLDKCYSSSDWHSDIIWFRFGSFVHGTIEPQEPNFLNAGQSTQEVERSTISEFVLSRDNEAPTKCN